LKEDDSFDHLKGIESSFVVRCTKALDKEYLLRPPLKKGVNVKVWCPYDVYLHLIWNIGWRECTTRNSNFWWVHKIHCIDETLPIFSKDWIVYRTGQKNPENQEKTLVADIYGQSEKACGKKKRHAAIYYDPQSEILRVTFSVTEIWQTFQD
jgi:hypothetical protein